MASNALKEAIESIAVGDSDALQSLLTNDVNDELLTAVIGPSKDTCTMEVIHQYLICRMLITIHMTGSEAESATVPADDS